MRIAAVALLVPDYDAAIAWYADMLGFDVVEDTALSADKRWVRIAPPCATGAALLLAKAAGPAQTARIGDQTGGRVFLFLESDDFDRDHAAMVARGVEFRESPRTETYGKVAVFSDPFGNLWDLVESRT